MLVARHLFFFMLFMCTASAQPVAAPAVAGPAKTAAPVPASGPPAVLDGFQQLIDGLLLQSFKDLQESAGKLAGKLDDVEFCRARVQELEGAYPDSVSVLLVVKEGGKLVHGEARPSFAGFQQGLDPFWKSLASTPTDHLHAIGRKDLAVFYPVRIKNRIRGAVGLVFTLEELLGTALKLHAPFKPYEVAVFASAKDTAPMQALGKGSAGIPVRPAPGQGRRGFIEDGPPRVTVVEYACKTVKLHNRECLVWAGRKTAAAPTAKPGSLTGRWTGALTQNRYGAERKQRGGSLDVMFYAEGGRMEVMFAGEEKNRIFRGIMRQNVFVGWTANPADPARPHFVEGTYDADKEALKGTMFETDGDAVVKNNFYFLRVE